MNFDAIPAMAAEQPEHSTDSELTAYARLVPSWVLRGHVIMGGIQLPPAPTRSRGFWSAFFFIPAGATGLAGGRGRANTLCCIVSCLVLSILAACVGFLAILANALMASGSAYRCDRNIYWCVRFMPSDILWFLLFFTELVVAIVHAAFSCRASCCCVDKNRQDREVLAIGFSEGEQPPVYSPPQAEVAFLQRKFYEYSPAMSQSSDFTSSVRQLPHRLLRAHVIMGAIQITVGCLQLEDLLGILDFPCLHRRRATGLAGGRGRSNTRCCLIGCLVLSSLAAIVSAGAIAVNIFMCFHQFGFASYADILWLLAYLLETVVAIVQSRMKAAAAGSDVILSGEEPPVSRAPGAGHVIAGVSQISLGCQVAFVTAVCLLAGIRPGFGIWTGPLFITAGAVGLRAAGAAPLDSPAPRLAPALSAPPPAPSPRALRPPRLAAAANPPMSSCCCCTSPSCRPLACRPHAKRTHQTPSARIRRQAHASDAKRTHQTPSARIRHQAHAPDTKRTHQTPSACIQTDGERVLKKAQLDFFIAHVSPMGQRYQQRGQSLLPCRPAAACPFSIRSCGFSDDYQSSRPSAAQLSCAQPSCFQPPLAEMIRSSQSPSSVQSLSSFAKRVPTWALRGLLYTGSFQLVFGFFTVCASFHALRSCGQLSSEVLCGFISGSVSISAGAAGLAAGRGRISSYFYMVTSAILSVLAACLGTLAIALLGLTFARGGTDSDFSVSDGLRVVLFLLELCVAVM
uniref:MARVEL domain-containing protein n=1 Tax=Macrostomum lignano TaxID=282301 RepID=A0A1I8IVN1_9PLAT